MKRKFKHRKSGRTAEQHEVVKFYVYGMYNEYGYFENCVPKEMIENSNDWQEITEEENIPEPDYEPYYEPRFSKHDIQGFIDKLKMDIENSDEGTPPGRIHVNILKPIVKELEKLKESK